MTAKLAQVALICATISAPAFAQDAAAPSFDWTGPYVGLNYTSGSSKTIDGGVTLFDLDLKGLGVQAGYLVDRGALVFGGELSYSVVSLDTGSDGDGATNTAARALVGYSVDRALLYASAGLGKVEFFDIDGPIDSDSGPMIGIGGRYAVTERMSVNLEYSTLMIKDFTGIPVDVNSNLFVLGVNYKF